MGLDEALGGIRVLELPGVAASFSGFVLRGLGAEVVKAEPVGGDPHRSLSPKIAVSDDQQMGAGFLAYNRGKSFIELDITTSTGVETLERMVSELDVIIEQPDAGWSAAPRLDIARLRAINPRIIIATITTFGVRGPYAGYLGGDLIAGAMSGFVHLTGEPGAEPVRMGGDQSLKLGGAEAAAGVMVALFSRDTTGSGQHIDVAIRDAVVRATVHALPKYEYEREVQQRVGDHWGVRDKPLRALWQCADGWVSFVRRGGSLGSRVNPECVAWMAEGGIDVSEFDGIDWSAMDMGNAADRQWIDRLDAAFEVFLRSWNVNDAFEEGLRRGMTLAPVRTIAGILDDAHLVERGYWDEMSLGERVVTMPGRFVNAGVVTPQRLAVPRPFTTADTGEAHA